MTTKRYCDRCGKETHNEDSYIYGLSLGTKLVRDLCDSCNKEVYNLMLGIGMERRNEPT